MLIALLRGAGAIGAPVAPDGANIDNVRHGFIRSKINLYPVKGSANKRKGFSHLLPTFPARGPLAKPLPFDRFKLIVSF